MNDNCFTEFCCFLSYLNMVSKIHQKVSIRFSLVTYSVASIPSARSSRSVEYFLFLHRFPCVIHSSVLCNKVRSPSGKVLMYGICKNSSPR